MSRVLLTCLLMALCLTHDSHAWQPAGYIARSLYARANGPGCIHGDLVCPELPPDVNDRCTAVDPPMPTVTENEADCSSYYECQGGTAVLKCCPDGQYWDTPMNTCDDLQHVDCGARPPIIQSCLTTSTTSTTITSTSTTPTLTPLTTSTTTTATTATTLTTTSTISTTSTSTMTTVPPTMPPPIGEKCSSYNGRVPLYIADESNCHQGWKCNGDTTYITIICPSQGGEQLVFNPILGSCDFPWHYPCDEHLMPLWL